MGDQTVKVPGTDRYVGPDTSNPFYQQLQSGGTYDPTKYFSGGQNAYQQGISALQGGVSPGQYDMARSQAQKTAEGAYTMFGQSAQDLAQQQARLAQNQVASEYAGSGALNSGAALNAISAGTAAPLLNAQTQLAQLYGNTYGGTANQLYGQDYGNLQAAAGMYGNLGQAQYGIGSQALGQLGNYAQSAYIAPQYYQQQGLGSGLMGVLTGGLAGGLSGGLSTGLGTALGMGAYRNLFGTPPAASPSPTGNTSSMFSIDPTTGLPRYALIRP